MRHTTLTAGGQTFPLLILDTAVIGTGCAGYNAADWLWDLGRQDIAILTEGIAMGTSRNTGSDKQTYYKLSLSSDGTDSVGEMAQDLFSGGGVNGDTTLAEAAGSVRSFIKLANLGVPFPTNAYGEYVGYKTDHDPRQRATSAGPLTSKYMTEALERTVTRKGIPVLDGIHVIRLLTENGQLQGALCLNEKRLMEPDHGLFLLQAAQIVLATGGSAGCYLHSVYPESQTGMSGMALEAGAVGANLNEWQYGLASLGFRWNVSGTYQQALPRYISIDSAGQEREFLLDYLGDPVQALNRVFLKGYQWPFDTEKLAGSSLIDLLVRHETVELGRRVFLDYRRNPSGLENGFDGISAEARNYLEQSGALLSTPLERLRQMNPPAIELYQAHGIDLSREPLEIGLCVQHHNGGLAVDANWETTIKGLYCAGEAAGTFGSRRPGGSALNSTQVGSLRAAEHIACTTPRETRDKESFRALAAKEAEAMQIQLDEALAQTDSSNVEAQRTAMQRQMSRCAACVRKPEEMRQMEGELKRKLSCFYEEVRIAEPREIPYLLKTRDIFVSQLAILSAMSQSAEQAATHGSALVEAREQEEGAQEIGCLPQLRYIPSRAVEGCLHTQGTAKGFQSQYIPVREIPRTGGWFETVWAEYRERTKPLGGAAPTPRP